jgi:hypothetical protein
VSLASTTRGGALLQVSDASSLECEGLELLPYVLCLLSVTISQFLIARSVSDNYGARAAYCQKN